VVDLERGGEGETNRDLRLRHLKGQPVLDDECMLRRDDLDEYIVMPNDDSRQDWVGCAGYTESPVAEERDEKETGERDHPTSD
jgi:hypothetical protein